VTTAETRDEASVITDPDRWIEVHAEDLYRYAWSRLRDDHAAEEVVQETFLAGIKFLHQHDGSGSTRAWLIGILKRKIVDHIRRRARYDRDGISPDWDEPEQAWFDAAGNWNGRGKGWLQPPEASLENRELWDVVRSCLTRLPPGQADVFTLSVMDGMESERICRELGITPANYWVRLHRARLGLAKCVRSKWFDDRKERADVE